MKQRALWPAAVLVAALALAGCGSAIGNRTHAHRSASGKLVVWDWKSGDKTAAVLRREGEGRLRQEAPRRHRRVRGPAVRPVLHPARRGHPGRQGPGRHAVQRRRADPRPGGRARCRWTSTSPRTSSGWPAGTRSPRTARPTPRRSPCRATRSTTTRRSTRRRASTRTSPPTTWDEFVSDCAAITKATGAKCFALGQQGRHRHPVLPVGPGLGHPHAAGVRRLDRRQAGLELART